MKGLARALTANLLPLSLGLADGILNALTIATGVVLHGDGGVGFGLAFRVGVVAFVTAAFTMFVAEYAEARSRIARAEVELNMTSSGRLATSRLGHMASMDAVRAAVVASLASLVGAWVPLAVGAAVATHSWLALVVALGALGGLGAVLAHVVGGRALRWTSVLLLAGVAVAAIGDQLHIA